MVETLTPSKVRPRRGRNNAATRLMIVQKAYRFWSFPSMN